MKVITIKQPWATLIAKGYKKYEFRTWKTNYRGPILIHAGKGIDKKAVERFKYLNLEYPKGCIIAQVNLTDCVKITAAISKKLIEKDKRVYKNLVNINDQIYGFKIEEIREIKPIMINGQLGLWNYDIKLENEP